MVAIYSSELCHNDLFISDYDMQESNGIEWIIRMKDYSKQNNLNFSIFIKCTAI
jgi:hypothetical protein